MPNQSASEVHVLRSRIESAFLRASQLKDLDSEVQADFAKYLCILVSGYVETAVRTISIAHCRRRAQPTVYNFAAKQLEKQQNLKPEKLIQAIALFNGDWGNDLRKFMTGSRWDALASVVSLRNALAHGQSVPTTFAQIRSYYSEIDQIVKFLENKLTPLD